MATPPPIKTTLKALIEANGTLSIPTLQSAVQSLVEVIKPIEKVNRNNGALQELSMTLRRLEDVAVTPLSTIFDAPGTSRELEARIESLARDLSEIAKNCGWLKKDRKTQVSTGDNTLSSAIIDMDKEVGASLNKFSRYSQAMDVLAIKGSHHYVPHAAEYLLSNELEDLPHASAASHAYASKQGLPSCFPGTREAVLNITDIWLNSSSRRVMLLKGSAGTGKSTIARTIATVVADQHRLAASFLFSEHDPTRNSSKLFFPTIAFHLAHHTEDFATRIRNALAQSPDVTTISLSEQFENLIVKPLSGTNQTTALLIVLDGLDECEGEGATQILQLLLNGLPKLPSYLKILITTQPEPHLQPVLDSLHAQQQVDLDQVENIILEGEIRRFLQRQLSQPKIEEALPGCSLRLKQEELNMLVKGAGHTFLAPAVIEKWVKDANIRNPRRQLEAVVKSAKTANSTKSSSPSAALDYCYTFVLELVFPAATTSVAAVDDFRSVVGAIFVLEVPLPIGSICRLLDTDLDTTKSTLNQLTSLLGPRGDESRPLARHHPLVDFITTPSRCKATRFLIQPATYHEQVIGRCFDVMTHLLKRNICQISPPDQYLENELIPNLEVKVKENIPQELEYACCHWASHLSKTASNYQINLEMLWHFASKQLLFWLEALSLTGHLDKAFSALQAAQKYIATFEASKSLRILIKDALRFVAAYQPIIKISALHIYHSALSFAPSRSVLSDMYAVEAASSFRVIQGREGYWDALLSTLTGHSSYVYHVVFSPDDIQLASAGGDKTIRIWDTTTGTLAAVLNGHTEEVYHVAFSPDGSLLVSASNDFTIRLWDVNTKELIATMEGHSKAVNSATFSPDGTLIASASDDKSVRLWYVANRTHKATLEGHTAWTRIIAFSPDGTQLASASGDNTIKVWEIGTGANIITLEGHSMEVRTVAFSPDGSRLATGSDDSDVRLWDAVTGAHQLTLSGHSGWVWDVAFSHDGTRVASASGDCTVQIWDAVTGVAKTTMKGHSSAVRSITFSHDDTRLASSSEDQTIRMWDAPGAEESIVESHSAEVDSVILSSNANRLLSVADSTFMLWDPAVGAHITTLDESADKMTPTLFSPDGAVLASSSAGNNVLVWDTTLGTHKATLEGHSERVLDIVFSSDSTKLASMSSDNTVRLWDLTTGASLARLECPFDQVLCITLSPDGTRLVAGSDDGRIPIWDTITGALIAMLERHSNPVRNIVFSSSGTQLASTSEGDVIVLWNAIDGTYITEFETYSGFVLSVAFSLNEAQVAAGSTDNKVRVWENSSGGRVTILEGHSGWVWSIIFSPDGSRLASAADDLTVRIWDIASSAPLVTLGGHYCYPDLSGVFSENNVHVVKKHGYPVLVHLCSHHDGSITQLPLCWLPPTIQPTHSRSSHGVVAVGTSSGKILCMNTAYQDQK